VPEDSLTQATEAISRAATIQRTADRRLRYMTAVLLAVVIIVFGIVSWAATVVSNMSGTIAEQSSTVRVLRNSVGTLVLRDSEVGTVLTRVESLQRQSIEKRNRDEQFFSIICQSIVAQPAFSPAQAHADRELRRLPLCRKGA
jgi:heme/copper-type cytochrome/quinol oxidase subunit 3